MVLYQKVQGVAHAPLDFQHIVGHPRHQVSPVVLREQAGGKSEHPFEKLLSEVPEDPYAHRDSEVLSQIGATVRQQRRGHDEAGYQHQSVTRAVLYRLFLEEV